MPRVIPIEKHNPAGAAEGYGWTDTFGNIRAVWCADFLKDDKITTRYQTSDPNGNPILGFFFKNVDCVSLGGRRTRYRRRRGSLKKRAKRRNTQHKR